MELRHALWAIGLAAAVLAPSLGCGMQPPRAPDAQVRFLLDPPDSRVYVEDRFLGAGRVLRQRARTFRPGLRHFTIVAPGHFPHDVELDLPSGRTTIRLTLRPIPE
ncbi:MAG: hypothetical protein AB8I08_17545 [Sandaracinaceae bacterium]